MRPILLALAAISVYGQEFEVASIKPSPPPTGRRMRVGAHGGPGTDDPGIFTCENLGISGLIARAFDLEDYQLSGPDWMQTTRFNVMAKIPPGTTKEQFRLMLQHLLAERFKLTYHRIQREQQAMALVVAKNGPKFKESAAAPSSADEPRDEGPPKKDANGFPVLRSGKGFSMAIENDRAALRAPETTMEQFAATLSAQLRQPVTDATGLTGKYDIALTWVPESLSASADVAGPSIYQAVQEQLGLKLESKKTMVDILIVDHVEKIPTEN